MTTIHPQLLNDCKVIGKFSLSYVLLMRDANYPWCILVPDRENISEIFELKPVEQKQLNLESNTLSQYLKTEFQADKMNVAALGNVVSQLHIHHIVRFTTDISWPAPVWGAYPAKAYSDSEIEQLVDRLRKGLESLNIDFSY